RRSQVQSGPAVVVGEIKIDPSSEEALDSAKIALAGGPAQARYSVDAHLLAPASGILLLVAIAGEVIVVVKVKAIDQWIAERDPTYAVADGTETGPPGAKSHDVGDDNHQGSRHAALRRKADRERELAGEVVHAARVHERKTGAHGARSQ